MSKAKKPLTKDQAIQALSDAMPSLDTDDLTDAIVDRYSYEEIIELQDKLYQHRLGTLEALKAQLALEADARDESGAGKGGAS